MDVVQIKNNRVVLVDLEQIERHRRSVQENSLKNLEKHHTSNKIQDSAKKQIEKMIGCWLKSIIYYKKYNSKKSTSKTAYPIFLTLTLPAQQIHDDRLIKKQCLIPFIQELVRVHGVKYYFWKAELQKTGNIHFHLIIDRYVVINDLKVSWNKHLESLGYITRYRKKWKHDLPHNIDVRTIDNIQAATAYLVKYVNKDEDTMFLFGAKWGCSDELKKLKLPYYLVDSVIVKHLNSLIELKKVYTYTCDYCTIFYFNKSFDYKVDYKMFESLEVSDYLKIYKTLYPPSGVLPAVAQTCRPSSSSSENQPRQLKLDLEFQRFFKSSLYD